MCGFRGKEVPPAWVYTRFLKKLFKYEAMVEEMFNKLVEKLKEEIPDLGKDLAMDSKAIKSLARRENKNAERDGRREKDADWRKKEYRGIGRDGRPWQKILKWFGYKLHLIVDSNHELPIAYKVTKASASDVRVGHELIDTLAEEHSEIVKGCETLEAERGYDDAKLITKLWDEYNIKPVIDIRDMWRDGEETRVLNGRENVVYNYKGEVYCYCLETGKRREMVPGGFDRERSALKKLCPAKYYGIECASMERCGVKSRIRISLEEDRRIFTPIDRASDKWERYYNKRSAVERVNSRLDVSFGFERHYIRGLKKMKVRCGIALCVMLAMALGRLKEKDGENIRSLVAKVS